MRSQFVIPLPLCSNHFFQFGKLLFPSKKVYDFTRYGHFTVSMIQILILKFVLMEERAPLGAQILCGISYWLYFTFILLRVHQKNHLCNLGSKYSYRGSIVGAYLSFGAIFHFPSLLIFLYPSLLFLQYISLCIFKFQRIHLCTYASIHLIINIYNDFPILCSII